MKKFFIIFIINIATIQLLSSQCDVRMYDIYTPKGTPVVTFLMCESSLQDRLALDSYFAQTYPQAIQLKTHKEGNDSISSTRKFNCHGYAWLKVETGIDRWIGTGWANDITDPERVFITDGSYIKIPQETYPGKVFWNSGDHTAVTTNQQGIFISKWNEYPLMKHAWNYSPYGTNDLKYYIKAPSISGPSTICSQATCTVDNLPPGAAVQWSVTPSYIAPTFAVLDSGTVILTNHYGIDGIGTHGTLQAVVTIGNQQITLTKDILFGWAIASIGKSRLDMRPGEYILEANTTNDPNTSITSTWSVTGPSAALVDFPYPDDASYADKAGRLKVLEVYTPGYYTVCATANDGNYTTQPYCTDFYIDDYKPAGGMFSLSPNPVTTSVTITMDETKLLNSNIQRTVTNPKSGNWQIQLWSSFGLIKQVETDQTSYRLDLTGVPPGFYYVHVIKDGQTYRRQLVVQ